MISTRGGASGSRSGCGAWRPVAAILCRVDGRSIVAWVEVRVDDVRATRPSPSLQSFASHNSRGRDGRRKFEPGAASASMPGRVGRAAWFGDDGRAA